VGAWDRKLSFKFRRPGLRQPPPSALGISFGAVRCDGICWLDQEDEQSKRNSGDWKSVVCLQVSFSQM
jgi:hypothetical protein